MLPTDPAAIVTLPEFDSLPELAEAVRRRIDSILTGWEESVRQLLPRADGLTFKQLRDDSFAILRQLADTLSAPSDGATAVLVESSRQHAGVRFEEQYDLRELIMEYRLLRRITMRQVESALHRNMTLAEQMALHRGIDTMLQRGVLAFAEYQQDRLRAATEIAQQAAAIAEAATQSKNDFLGVLSHELRNPLNPVVATATLLRDDPRFDADTREQLEVICRNAQLAVLLIDDLLDVTRIGHGKIELHKRPVSLGTIVQHAAEVCQADIKARKLQFAIELSSVANVVEADPARLQQVFWNLIRNAVKFTPAGGSVGIRCRRGDGHVMVDVHDSGEGIAPDVLPGIFNAFEQGGHHTTRKFGGLGLGLTIAKAMIELHGGTIEARSEGKDKGATFTIRLPLMLDGPAKLAALVESASPTPASSAARRPLRVLLVEDQGDTAQLIRRALSAKGHEVQIAGDVAMALQLAAEHPFDLLLSDLGLPDGTGLDLMRTLRGRGQMMPGIAISGYGQEMDVQESLEAGFAAHLVKPVKLSRLAEAIAEISGDGTPVAGGNRVSFRFPLS